MNKNKEKINKMRDILQSIVFMAENKYLTIKNPADQEKFIKEVKVVLKETK